MLKGLDVKGAAPEAEDEEGGGEGAGILLAELTLEDQILDAIIAAGAPLLDCNALEHSHKPVYQCTVESLDV